MIEADQIEAITAADVRSSDDEKVGSVGQVFLDAQTGRPEWAAVRTGFFGTKEAFVPLRNADWDGRVVRVAYDKERVRNAPHVDPDNRGLAPDQQVELYTYYGFTETSASDPRGTLEQPSMSATDEGRVAPPPAYQEKTASSAPAATPAESLSAVAMSELDSRDDATAADLPRSESGPSESPPSESPPSESPPSESPPSDALPPDSLSAIAMSELADRDDTDDGATVADDGVVTRMEEHLEVGVEQRATERVRLRKHIVTQKETVTVTLRREELRIERVPISADEAAGVGAGGTIGESETEIILYEERPVVTTVARPVERIRLTREVVSDEETVTGDVRKERVEMDDGGLT